MQRKSLVVSAACLAALIGLAFIAVAFLPYEVLKGMADSLMRDGNLKILNASNAYVFKAWLGFAALALLGLAYAIGWGRMGEVGAWFRAYGADLVSWARSLRPARVETGSLIVLLLIVALGVVFRLVYINDVMTHDESYTFAIFGSKSIFLIVTNYDLPNNHVLNSLLIRFSIGLFGIQPWAVRLPALIAGLLIIPATYGLAKSIYDRHTGLASALLIAFLPGAVLYSATARGYSLVALCTVLTLWLASYLRANKNRFAWSLLILFSALGFYSVPVMLLPFGMVFAWLFFENLLTGPGPYSSKISFLKYWLAAGLGTALLVLLLYTPIFIVTGADKVFGNAWVLPRGWNDYFPSLPGFGLYIWNEWTRGMSPLLTWLLLAGFVSGLIFHRRIAGRGFPLQVAALLWLIILVVLRRPQLDTKLWASCQAPLMIWCAAGIVGPLRAWNLGSARKLPASALAVGITALLAGISAVRLLPTIPQRWNVKGSAEYTVLFIKDRIEPDDLIIVKSPYDAPIWYYSAQYGIGDDHRFDGRRPFEQLYVVVDHGAGQTLESVLQVRGPDLELIDVGAARFLANYQNLDIYVVPHR